MPSTITRLFVPNRGVVARRILCACFEDRIHAVIGCSSVDRDSLPARVADQTVCIGDAPPAQSYLNAEAVVAAALGASCDAIHPGYGFLAENPKLSQLCQDNGLIFVGPPPEALQLWGDKVAARNLAQKLGIPVGASSEVISDPAEAVVHAAELGYPLMLKSVAGGGGRGIRVVRSADELAAVAPLAAQEARAAFGDGDLFLERYIERGRHVEVQVLVDHAGNAVHLGTRDCSVQRRFQKLIEEAPAVGLPSAVTDDLCEAALKLVVEGGHVGAATVEFLYDNDSGSYLFLEVNGRLQVEHGVTELVTGVDIVRAQLQIAAGEPLTLSQDQVVATGHAVELRLTCEDPAADFLPRPGVIETWAFPEAGMVRVDTHCHPGYRVPPYYDSLLANVMVRGDDRADAISRARQVIAHTEVTGVPTNADLLDEVLGRPEFARSEHFTRWLEDVVLPSHREHRSEEIPNG